MQRAAEGHVHLLQAPADAEQGNATFDAGLDQAERHGVARLIVGLVLGVGLDAETAGMDVGARARQHDAVDRPQQGIDVGDVGRPGEHQRQGTGHFGNSAHVALAHDLDVVTVVDDRRIADHAHYGLTLSANRRSPCTPEKAVQE